MMNITLAIDDEVVKKVRKLAVDRNTSLNALVREALQQFAVREDLRTQERIAELESCFLNASGKVGEKNWSRDDLHAR